MAAATIEHGRALQVMAALRELLTFSGWEVRDGSRKAANGALEAQYGGGAWVRFQPAGAKSSSSRADQLVVTIHDDARPLTHVGQWSDLRQVAAAAREPGNLDARLGWDLIFGFGASETGALTRYLEKLQDSHPTFGTAVSDEGDPRVAQLLLKALDQTFVRDLGVEDFRQLVVDHKSPLTNVAGANAPRNLLLAFSGCEGDKPVDQAAFLVSRLIGAHVSRLQSNDRGGVSLPLLLIGEAIRLDGLDSCMRAAFYAATGKSYSSELYRALAQLGYLHLYVANGAALRVDQDFDPNTRHVSQLLSYCEGSGRFTFCCSRDHVFHDNAPQPSTSEDSKGDRWEIGALKTLGQRFFLAEGFCIADFGERSKGRLAAIEAYADSALEQLSREVSERSGGRCGSGEARVAFNKIGTLRNSSEAGVVARGGLRDVAAGILTTERKRPTHIAIVESALAQSNALLELGGGRYMVRDSLLGEYLVASEIARALRFSLIIEDHKPLLDLFDSRVSEPRIFELACHVARLHEISDVASALNKMVAAFKLFEGPKPDFQIRAENAVRLWFAAVQYLTSDLASQNRRDLFAEIKGSAPVKLVGMALPQFTFRDVSLRGWSLENCNLRSTAFVGSDLGRLVATDCFLGGTVFKDCQLDDYIRLPKSNLSGSWFGGATNSYALLREGGYLRRFENVNWTLALIGGEVTSPDDDETDRAETKKTGRRAVRDEFAVLRGDGGVLIDVTAIGKGGAKSTERPAEFQAALLKGRWASVVVDEDEFGKVILRRADADARSLRAARQRAVARVRVRGRDKAVSPGLIGIDENGRVQLSGGVLRGSDGWVDVGGLTSRGVIDGLATFDQDALSGRILAAALVRGVGEGGGQVIEIIDLTIADGRVTSFAAATPELDVGDDTALTMRWIRASTQASPELYLGYRSGLVRKVAPRDGQLWKLAIASRGSGVEVSAITYARRSQVIVVAHADGLVTGVQFNADEDASPLFSFKTAIRQVFDMVYLEGEGDQMVLVGRMPEGDGALCVLMNAAGDVLAVFPRAFPELDESAEEFAASADAVAAEDSKKKGAQPERTAQAHTQESLELLLRSYSPERARLEIRPLSRTDAGKDLIISLNGREGAILPPVVDTADGPAFRHVRLDVECFGANGERTGAVQPVFTDHQFSAVEVSGHNIRVAVPLGFGRDTERATLKLRIGFMVAGVVLGEEAYEIGVDIIWRDNPYESSGRATGSEQFFGRSNEVEFCYSKLSKGYGVGIRAARRMGKSSFLSSVARRLAGAGHLAIVVSLAGAAKPSAELASLIVRGAEDPLAPAPKEFVDLLRRQLLASSPRSIDALKKLGEIAQARSFKSPTVVLIDEWGVVSNTESPQYDRTFEQQVGELIYNPAKTGIAIGLASAPADFGYRETVASSDFYRGLKDLWVDLGPLDDKELVRIMSEPVEKRSGTFKDRDACFARLKDLSSGDPYAANVIMSRAFDSALQRSISGGASGQLVIRPDDIDNDNVRRDVAGLYEVHLGYTFDRLTPENRARLMEEAAKLPTPWDGGNLPMPDSRADPRQWSVFGGAGFRRASSSAGMSGFVVWIPKGFSLNVAAKGGAGV